MIYQQMIAQATGVDDPVQLEEIEEMMRDEAAGTLDHLGPTEFSQLARDLRQVNDAIRGL